MGLLGAHVKAKPGRSKFETHLRNENGVLRDDSGRFGRFQRYTRRPRKIREGGNEPSQPIETLHRRGVQRPRRSLAGLWPDSKISRIFDRICRLFPRSFRVISIRNPRVAHALTTPSFPSQDFYERLVRIARDPKSNFECSRSFRESSLFP